MLADVDLRTALQISALFIYLITAGLFWVFVWGLGR